MSVRKLAAVGVGVVVAVGLSGAPASAAPSSSAFQDRSATPKCLDFRADFGPYVTRCNYDAYQVGYWDDNAIAHTALRQRATELCLTLRNGQPAMKACSAADRAALWAVDDTSTAGALIKNEVSGTCLARTTTDRVNAATCTGGPSQWWDVINGS
ncbi:RICIN domain-containing protein [Streptomyces sp. NPDC099050]|uniref:RICIN domain-containing protein n=1 Tax=Streptomyces sp. NPDC099050 TaxID=3366100 RepID=UPI00382A2C8D